MILPYFTSYKPPFNSGFFQPSKELWFCRGGIKWLIAPHQHDRLCRATCGKENYTLTSPESYFFHRSADFREKNHQILSGWWYTYLSEKYEFVSWDYSSQYIYNYIYIYGKITNVPNHQPDNMSKVFPMSLIPPTEPIWAHQEAQPDMWFDVKKCPIETMKFFTTGPTSKASATVTCRCHGDSWRRSVICLPT